MATNQRSVFCSIPNGKGTRITLTLAPALSRRAPGSLLLSSGEVEAEFIPDSHTKKENTQWRRENPFIPDSAVGAVRHNCPVKMKNHILIKFCQLKPR